MELEKIKIYNWLNGLLNTKVIYNYRIYNNDGLFIKLDIYIPEKKLAIEYNEIYSNSELNGKDKNYHLNKTKICQEKNIQLIHIFENEWLNKEKIVRSIILSKLGIFNKIINSNNCKVIEIIFLILIIYKDKLILNIN
jgi:hypothetical protein